LLSGWPDWAKFPQTHQVTLLAQYRLRTFQPHRNLKTRSRVRVTRLSEISANSSGHPARAMSCKYIFSFDRSIPTCSSHGNLKSKSKLNHGKQKNGGKVTKVGAPTKQYTYSHTKKIWVGKFILWFEAKFREVFRQLWLRNHLKLRSGTFKYFTMVYHHCILFHEANLTT
jgi:hypothetical protein